MIFAEEKRVLKRKKYSQQQLQQAIDSVRNQEMSYTEAANHYQVPISTVHNHINKYGSESKCK